MGSALSHNNRRSSVSPASARVIAADGSLTEYFPASSPAVSVSDVLGDNEGRRFFLCSSDALYFDEDVPALDGGELLRAGQIYFVLPATMLGRPLSRTEMAAMAVRASEALAARARPLGRARGVGSGRKVRATPVHDESGGAAGFDAQVNEKLNERTLGEDSLTGSGSPVRTGKRVTVPAFSPAKRALTPLGTIDEDAE